MVQPQFMMVIISGLTFKILNFQQLRMAEWLYLSILVDLVDFNFETQAKIEAPKIEIPVKSHFEVSLSAQHHQFQSRLNGFQCQHLWQPSMRHKQTVAKFNRRHIDDAPTCNTRHYLDQMHSLPSFSIIWLLT